MPESPDFISRLQIAVINARAKLGSGFTQDADRAGAYLEISNVLMSEANALAGSDPDTSQRYLDAARMIQEQAEITTYSGDNGIAAITGNLRAKLNNPETYKISLDEFSFLIDDSILRFFENVAEFGDKESISKNNILAVDGLAWDSLGLLDYFPGNAITYSFDANLGSSVWLNASAEQKAKLFGIDQSMGIIGKIELGAAIGFPQLFSLGKSPSAFGFTDPDEISLLQFGGEIIREDVHGRSWRLIKSQDGIVSIVDNNVKTVGTDIDNPVYGHTAYVDNGYDMANVGQQIGLKLAAILFPATLYRQFATVEVNPDTGQEYYILSPQAVDSIKNFMQADFGLLGTRFAYAEGQPVLTLADLQNASGTGAGGKISSNISVIADPDNPNVFTVIGSGPSLSGQGTRVVSVEVGKDSGGNEVINRSVVIELTSSGTIASAEISEAEQVRILNLAEAARIQAQIADFAHRSTSQQPELIYGDLGELIGVDDQVTGGGQTSDIGKAFLTAKVDANGNLTLEGHTTKLIAFDPRSRVARYQISAGVDEFGREVTQEWSLNLENDQYKYSGKTQTIDGALTITQDINGPTTIRLSNSPIHMDFVDGAQVIANTLGRYIAGDDVLTQTLTTAALNTIAANFGDVLNTLAFDSGIATSDNLSHAFDGIDAELLANIKSAGIGAVSSFLSAQLIDSLGIGGVPGELLNTAAGQAINVIITNLSNGAYVFKDLSRTSITNAAGSYVGNKLASEIADWDEVGEQIGAQIGSAIGATIASGIPVIGTAIGAFFGNLIGGLIGGIFTGAPKSGAILGFDEATGQFQVEAVWKEDGGKRAVARQLGNTAAASLNGILATIGGELLNGDDVEAGSYGMRKKAFVYWNDGTSSDNRIKFATASDLVEYGVMKAARDMQIIGGDIYAKRAFYLTMAQGAVTSSNNDGSGSDDGLSSTNVDFGLDLLVGNLAVADRLKVYLANSASINALIAAEPNSVFTTDWMIALSRASELGLLKRNTHDWDGGFSYLLSQGDVDARDVGFRFETSSRQGNGARVMYLDGAALEDTVDTGSKTVVQGGSEDDVLAALAGGSRDGAATGAAYHISNVFHGGAGDDHIVAGDTGDDLFGDDGNDVLVGGQLDDWLFGGTGNDVLDAGGGSGNVLIAGSGDDQLVGADGISSDPMNSGSDWLLGGLGSDRLYGQGGDDYFEADQGNDFVEGGAGSDTIIFRTGDGIDRISDNGLDDGDTDVVAFGDDISPDDVEVIASSSSIDMSMLLGYDGDQADLRGAAVTSRAGIEAFDFGTTVWSRGQMTAQAIFAKNAGISVSGTGAGENIAGTRYDDTLSGGDGDTLQGDFGSDEYLFSLGDGTVVIEEAGFGSDLDVLTFGAGITVANIAVSHSAAAAQDIVITVGTGGDQIILRNQLLKSGAQSIEEVRFQDGTSLTLRDIEALAAPVFTNGNDTAWGFDSDDVFSGGDGSDTLAGGRGNDDLIGGGSGDTFIYNSGDGDDRISDGFWDDGTDTLILGAGIAPEDLILTRDVLDSNNLRIRFKTGSGSILLDGQNSGRTAGIEQIQFADGTIWDRATMDAQMVAQSVSAKADIVRTGYVGAQYVARDDVVSAGAGNDIINTGQGVDIITGGAGDDDLAGGSEADTYVYNIGDGDDRIVEGFWDDGTDTLLFGENILPEELIFSRDVLDGNNLRITFTNQVGSILIDGHTSGRAAGIEQIQFADGTIWDRAAIDAQFLAQSQSSGSDIIRTGYYGAQYIARDDVILAGGGRDTIYAGQGVDTITGGVGNDELFGGEEGDTYIYNIGDGDDRVAEEYWGNGVDALQFGAGVSAADLVLSRDVIDPGNLRVSFLNQTGSILIDGQFAGGRSEIEEFRFADGTTWNAAAIAAQMVVQMSSAGSDIIRDSNLGGVIQAGAGNDTVYAGGGADVITGGIGNDDLFGGEDGDTYVYEIGDGHDRIAEDYWGNGDDVLLLGEGIDTSTLVLTTDVLDGNNLRIDFVGQAGSVLVEGQFNQGRNGLEKIQFADGTIWDRTAIGAQVTVRSANIVGTNAAETLSGTVGTDQLYGYNGNDTLAGGTGNDFLNGGGNDDVYLFNLGDGSDTINDDSGTDTIRFGTGISSTDLVLMAPTVDDDFQGLIIAIAGTQDRIYIRNQNANNGRTIERFEFTDGTVLTSTDLRTQLMVALPTSGDDKIRGSEFAETINGGAGDDEIDAYSGADIISGGHGNDYLNGGGGEDVYLFNLGDGSDTINDDSGTDTIRFGAGISSPDLVLMAPTVDDDFQGLIIAIAGTQDRIYIRNQNANNGRTIERFEFADGTVLTNTDLRTQLMAGLPTSGDDKIRGSEFAETINGGAGDDEIDAYSGADIISGGHGNDYLNGGGGEDVYLFNLGDGSDTINDDSGTDTIRFGAGISSPDLVLMASTVDDDFQGLIIAIAGTQDRIYIRNQNANNGRTIERFEFADGTVLTNTDLRTQLMAGLPTSGDDKIRGSSFADTINGGSGSDEIEGFDGNDILAGGKGDDYLNGGANDDTYIFNRYDGFETIFDDWGNDTLKLGAGIAESDVIVSQALDDGDTSGVILTFKGSDDKIYLRSELDGNRIDTIQFHTGETWNVAGLLNLLRGTTINGKSNPVTMGDDVVIGSAVADTIRGMRGDDALRGGMGSDTYRFARGDGYDTIYDPDEAAATDVLIFEGINSTDVAVMVSPTDPDDIILYVDDENIIYLDQIRDGARSGIDEVRFADGAIWDRQTLLAKASGGQGTTGDNLLIGSNFADSLTGGAGNDRLVGGAGNDVYTYNSGDGNDVIVDMADDASPLASSGDTLSFGAGIALADIRLMRNTADGPLIIAFAGQAGSITLEGTQTDGLSGVQFLKFADGSVHNMADVRQAALNGAATGGNDLIEGFSTADVLAGGTGNDTLIGRGGADVYHFAIGDGQDMIIESDGQANRLIFAAGITSGTLRLYRTIDAPDDLIIALPDGTDKVVLKGQLSSSGKSGLAMIAFADGATWDRDEIIERLLSQPATADADYLVGSDENDSIDGLAGNDFIEGGRGDDLLYGAGGNDILSGGIGADALHGGDGDDILSGDEGLDTLDGGNGYDTADYSFSLDRWNINLATGEAAIIRDSGAAPAETLISFEAVKGGLGSDQITGDDTANRLQGGAGNDILQGGGGDDVFIVEGDEDGIDAVDGGTGYDRMEAAVDGTVFGLSGISNVELITANSHANVRIEATDDNDVLDFSSAVLEGIVSIELGAGDDVITGSLGADAINAGAGNDVIRYVGLSLGGDTVDGSDGSDRIEAGADGAVIRLASFQNVETITGGQFAGVVLARTDAGETTNLNGITVSGLARIDLEGGDDIYVGTAQSEVVRGGSGDDTLSGAAGDDIFDYLGSASGRDSVDGGSGYDRLRASADDAVIGIRSITGVEAIDGNGFANVTLQLTSGNDTLDLNAVTMTGITAIVAGAGNDIIRGSTGDDRFLVSGQGQGLDDIDGGAGQDRILAGASNTAIGLSRLVNVETIDGAGYQNVTIAATSGNDSLSLANVTVTGVERIDLGAGNDSFTGSSGDDIVVGGTGNDQLAGGGGDDSYVFNIGDGQDVVSDTATSTSDRIRFGSGILGDDIQVTKVNADQDLLLTIGTTGDTLLIKEGAVFGTSHGVEYVDFADGTQWSRAQLIAKTYANYAPTAINVSGSLPSPQFTGAGWAAQVSQNEYLLTPNASNRSGAIWGAVDLSADAEWTTRMYFGANDGGADGLSFVLQNSSPTALGSGGALVNGSLGIWFDTYQNGSEPASDFSKIVLNGNVGDQSFDAYHTHGNLENGVWRDVVIQWNADAKSLSYSLDGAVVSSKVYDVVGNLFSGDSTAYFGFGAATGGATNQHSVQLISSTGKTGALAVAEDAIPGTLIGRLATVDANAGDAFTYQIVDQSGTPVADANFILDDNRILIKQGADLETMPQAVYNLNIKTTDAGGASFVQAVQINVTQSHVDVGPTGFELLAPVSYNATRVGSAFKATDSIYQLTPNSGNQTGAIWSAVDLTKDTIWTTKIYLGANDGGADGLAFALQGTSSTALADTGVLTSQSVGIKFDTYTNGNEPAADFSKLVVNGNLTSHAFDLYHTHQNLEDNAWHDVVIRWDADLRSLAYSLDGVLISSRTLDPSNDPLAGLSNAYFGFGAATGGATNLHSVDIRGMMSVVSGFAIQENAASGALVGVVTPVGGAVGSSYSFEFIDENGATVTNAFFEFGSGGELRVRQSAVLDYELEDLHSIRIKATDMGGRSYSATIEVAILDQVGSPLSGSAGNDVLLGTQEGDTISGVAGNDLLVGGSGDDVVNGGDGDDVIHGDGRVPVGPNLVVNSSFEDLGSTADNIRRDWGVESADIAGWTKSNSQPFEANYSGTQGISTSDGAYWLDMTSIDGAQSRMDIQQSFSNLAAGEEFLLQFDVARPSSAGNATIEALWNGVVVATISDAGSQMTTVSRYVTATSATNQLQFRTTAGPNYYGVSLDNVRLFATEPSDGGDDYIDGGLGADIVVFRGDQADYTIATISGTVTITDNAPGVDWDDGTDTLVSVETALFKDSSYNLAAPIVLDLDGDGVNLLDLHQSHARFDWNGDGLADKTGWVAKGDGLLFFDRNGDGEVSGANELSFIEDKPGAKSDLDGLSAFDTNGDGLFDRNDDQWSQFKIWKDINGNGVAASEELFTMADVGIQSISLEGQATAQAWSWESNIVLNHGSFTWEDGRSGTLDDVAMNYIEAKVETHLWEPQAMASRLIEAMAPFDSSSAAAFSIEELEKSRTLDIIASHVRLASGGNFN